MDDVTFGDMASNLGSAFIIIPIIAILESVAIAKAFCKSKQVFLNRKKINILLF